LNGFGHVRKKCANLLKQKKNSNINNESDTDSDDGEQLRKSVAFRTLKSGSKTKSAVGSASASLSGSSCGGGDDVGSDNDYVGSLDLAANYEQLFKNWLKLVEANSEFTKEKVMLEAQVAETLKYASEKEEEARHGSSQLRETRKYWKKNDRFGLGFQREYFKAESVFESAEKTEAVAASATKPEVKMSAENATNGKAAVKTATYITATSTATTTSTGKVFDLKTVSQRKFKPICHHCDVVGEIT
ncbi:hypothetical protein N665_0127s0018, partial [Sinapis alba]